RLTTPRFSENGPWPAIIVLAITHRARRKAASLSGLSRQRFSALALNVRAGGLASGSYQGHSGKHMLVTSLSQAHPKRT
ncbi:MAG: hypothetical protein WA624_16465, partial [Methylocella sp.]